MSAPALTPLTPEDWQRVSGLFDTARDLAPDALQAWLSNIERSQPELTTWLRALLRAQVTRRGDVKREPHGPQSASPTALDLHGLAPGSRVGPWVLSGLLGSGGMATVWRAHRADARPARTVALKLPLLHRAGSGLAQRFARERDILAGLNHPHIAPLYDAGTAEDGTPWLAMECVEGMPIDRWCDERRLGVRERLTLFAQILDAVQYAHARLVIHRDIKPANILVTADGQVRLLDFGIAKLLDDGSGTAPTALTQAAVRVLTPAYAAPEQLLGHTLTTATDLYALGVVLFELLCGTRPYEVRLDTLAQIELAIAQGHLRRASQSVSVSAAERRGSTARRLSGLLRGDLERILAKALRHAPTARYASAAEFADDLRRWAHGEPVRAHADTMAYRWRRFLARHRTLVGAVSFACVALVAATAVSLAQRQRADRERDQAVAARAHGDTLSAFLMDLLISAANQGQTLTMPTLMARAEAGARAAFADRPDDLAQALFIFGAQRREFDDTDKALAMLGEAMHRAQDPNLRAEVACDYGATLHDIGRRDEGLATVRQAIDSSGVSAFTRSTCLNYLTLMQLHSGNLAQALQSQQSSVELMRNAHDVSWQSQERDQMMLVYLQALSGQADDPDSVFASALRRMQAAGRDRAMNGIELRNRWAQVSLVEGDAQQALSLLEDNRRGLEGQQPPSPLLGWFDRAQGVALAALGRDAEAEQRFAAAVTRAAQGEDHVLEASSRCLGAAAAARLGALQEAGARLAQGLARLSPHASVVEEDGRACAMASAAVALAQGRPDAAQEALVTLLADARLAPHPRAEALLLASGAALQLRELKVALQDARAALDLAQRLQGRHERSYLSARAQAACAQALAASSEPAATRGADRSAAVRFLGTPADSDALRQKVEQRLALR